MTKVNTYIPIRKSDFNEKKSKKIVENVIKRELNQFKINFTAFHKEDDFRIFGHFHGLKRQLFDAEKMYKNVEKIVNSYTFQEFENINFPIKYPCSYDKLTKPIKKDKRTATINQKTWKSFKKKKEVLKYCVEQLFNNPKFHINCSYPGVRSPKARYACTTKGYPSEYVELEDLDIEVKAIIEAQTSRNLSIHWPLKFDVEVTVIELCDT